MTVDTDDVVKIYKTLSGEEQSFSDTARMVDIMKVEQESLKTFKDSVVKFIVGSIFAIAGIVFWAGGMSFKINAQGEQIIEIDKAQHELHDKVLSMQNDVAWLRQYFDPSKRK